MLVGKPDSRSSLTTSIVSATGELANYVCSIRYMSRIQLPPPHERHQALYIQLSQRDPLQSLLNTISSARRIHSSALHRSTLAPCFRSSTSPISSHARRTTSTSCFVCAAERQNRTRDEIKGVALQPVGK